MGGETTLLISASEQRRREFIWNITKKQPVAQHNMPYVAAMIKTAMPYFNAKTQREITLLGCFGFGSIGTCRKKHNSAPWTAFQR